MLRPVLRTQLAAPILSYQIPACRLSSTTSSAQHARGTTSDHALAKPHTIDPRWLTMIKRRIGKCMMFGLKPDQVDEGGKILQQLANDWRELIAGSEGFLTDKKRRSLFRHNVVWGEQLLGGHVNNVTYVRYAETARVNWTRNIGTHIDPANKKEWNNLVGSTGIGLILRSIKVDYKFPMTSPDKITVYQRLVPDPNSFLARQSAFQLQVLILSEAKQRPAARCHEDIVTYDYKKNQKTHNLPPFVKDQFKVIYELQEQAQKEWQQQVAEIENRVRTLELESWDRVDAIEDKGSS
ncbi:hypothetical protein N7508_010836 [Penicillium antarcticum]|uniref:uncharacterized protein n=1 Tax=Penicillium antarcticum TaxID=416450 RepID=UPI00238F8D4A|nr:uncharacterized protein N7508_010836 [Penicillium antarcticum]KAJ5296015.1 hypothetical protein N7508_010836 [Penicillium antarcticum]